MKMEEIERKFLVKNNDFEKEAIRFEYISQGFLSTDPERTVRIRIKNDKGIITIKGASNKEGTTRFEWEKEITVDEAKSLLALCTKSIIEKTRYLIPAAQFIFEVDVFSGDNEGLIIAEIELSDAHEAFPKPPWLGDEVTGQIKYYNSQLSKNPYNSWNHKL